MNQNNRYVQQDNDPFTMDVIQNSLQAISDEMFIVMRKTAMSAIIYEVLDMGTGITDSKGEIASSGAGIPSFIGVLDKAVKAIIAKFSDPSLIRQGDVFATNDPWYGGVTHLNDVVLLCLFFLKMRLLLGLQILPIGRISVEWLLVRCQLKRLKFFKKGLDSLRSR